MSIAGPVRNLVKHVHNAQDDVGVQAFVIRDASREKMGQFDVQKSVFTGVPVAKVLEFSGIESLRQKERRRKAGQSNKRRLRFLKPPEPTNLSSLSIAAAKNRSGSISASPCNMFGA